jgi:hypothetical protein
MRERERRSPGLFGRAPAPAPRAAPREALPNDRFCYGSGCGAAPGAPRGFRRGGGATISWLHPAPPPFSHHCPRVAAAAAQRQEGGDGGTEAEGKREERGREEGGGNTWCSVDSRRRPSICAAGVTEVAPPESGTSGAGAQGGPGKRRAEAWGCLGNRRVGRGCRADQGR